MSIIKLTPRNLSGILRKFQKEKLETETKIRQLNKKKYELEKDLETLKDGIDWCEAVYKAGKG